MWLLESYDSIFVFISLGSVLYSVVGNLLSCDLLHVSPNAELALAFGIAFFVAGLWLVFRQLVCVIAPADDFHLTCSRRPDDFEY
jgi:hypothetical protein